MLRALAKSSSRNAGKQGEQPIRGKQIRVNQSHAVERQERQHAPGERQLMTSVIHAASEQAASEEDCSEDSTSQVPSTASSMPLRHAWGGPAQRDVATGVGPAQRKEHLAVSADSN
ncbi:hypothetical protein [Amycolatopsis mediterranei]|uniref:hypothetical protein n=1 Tax=Amycolatopsis mediterranei TaxID=33910 RepID=UPI00114CE113|nr:hypothetical protein [Amycolatopsis mediterranei]UZF75804.1 hypothetical protein ISP_009434 [Amycolatopsis mediterranei]